MRTGRRRFMQATFALSSTLGLSGRAASAGGANGKKPERIAVEEGFSIPEIAQEMMKFYASEAGRAAGWQAMAQAYAAVAREWGEQTLDLGPGRLAAMDAHGIQTQLLLLGAVGVQALEPTRATELTRLANDRLAEACRRHPGRFAGLTALAPQDPENAALEFERGISQLGFRGAVINSNAADTFLDGARYRPIFEVAASLGKPIYLHPSVPAPQHVRPYLDYGLVGPMWGFNAEASVHALRLILSGLFDDLPKLRIVLGHLGEGIPFYLTRIDIHARKTEPQRVPKLKRLPSEYFREHFFVTTSGMNASPALPFCVTLLGADRILFAADYPYETLADEVPAFDRQPLAERDREAIYHLNAERVFGL